MRSETKTRQQLQKELEELLVQQAQMKAALLGAEGGNIDAVVFSGPDGERVWTLDGADLPYRVPVDLMTESALTLAADGTILFCNPAFAQLVNSDREEVIGYSVFDFIVAPERKRLKVLLAHKSAGRYRAILEDSRGTRSPVRISTRPLHVGRMQSLCVLITDLTEVIAAKEERSQLAAIVESSHDAIIAMAPDGIILTWNHGAEEIYGYTAQEMIGKSILLVVPPGCAGEMTDIYHKIQKGEHVEDFESERVRKNGQHFSASLTASPIRDLDGKVVGICKIVRDITERKRAEETIRRSKEQLQDLADRLISAREEEGKRLARDLHDAFSQRLAALSLKVGEMDAEYGSTCEPLSAGLRDIVEEIRQLAGDVHQIAQSLHPAIVDDLGLTAALNAECGAFSRQHGITVAFRSHNMSPSLPLPGDTALCLYRIAQESLGNVVRHAQATRVRVTLEARQNEIVLTIEDDGKGFQIDDVKGKGRLGLISMQERARVANGRFLLRTATGKGTTIEVGVPFNATDSEAESVAEPDRLAS